MRRPDLKSESALFTANTLPDSKGSRIAGPTFGNLNSVETDTKLVRQVADETPAIARDLINPGISGVFSFKKEKLSHFQQA